MFHGEDHDGVSEIVKANAVVTDTEAEFGRLDILEAFNIAFSRGEITSHNVQNAKSGSLVDSTKVGLGLVSPGDFLPHRYWPLL